MILSKSRRIYIQSVVEDIQRDLVSFYRKQRTDIKNCHSLKDFQFFSDDDLCLKLKTARDEDDAPDCLSASCKINSYGIKEEERRFQEDLEFMLSDISLNDLSALQNDRQCTFTETLLGFIDSRRIPDTQVYRAANIDRRLFSKIVSDRDYRPSKDTCLAFAFALQLNSEETDRLLNTAGYVLSDSITRDRILKYLIDKKIYNIVYVNIVLDELKQKIIGR